MNIPNTGPRSVDLDLETLKIVRRLLDSKARFHEDSAAEVAALPPGEAAPMTVHLYRCEARVARAAVAQIDDLIAHPIALRG